MTKSTSIAKSERKSVTRIATFIAKGKEYHAVNKRAHKLCKRMGKRSVLTLPEVKQACKERNNSHYTIKAKVYREVDGNIYGKLVAIR